MNKKSVTILHASKNSLSFTNAKSVNVWKETSPGHFEFSHVEKLKPTHTLEEIIGTDKEDTTEKENK